MFREQEELIKERGSSFTSPLISEHPAEVKKDIPFSGDNYFSSTLSTCAELPIYKAKALFIEQEPEINTSSIQELQKKQKVSFLKKLTDIKTVKETLSNWTSQIRSFFGAKQSDTKIRIAGDSSTPTKKNKTSPKEAGAAPAPSIPLDDVEKRRIKEIEDIIVSYVEELEKSGGGNMNAMMEMACKIVIFLGTLGYRYNKKEIKDYIDHLDASVKKRIKTFEGGRTWTYISVAIQGVSAVFSFASLGSSAATASSYLNLGKVLEGLGGTATPLGYFGQATSKLGDIDSEKKTAQRTEHEHESEKLKQARSDMDRLIQNIYQTTEQTQAAQRSSESARAGAINSTLR